MKDLFTGALGRLNNHGGSKIFTTPNTILVPPEYEINIGEHGNFISCTLDGRLWLFEDRIVALKWNEVTSKMEYTASKSFSDENFIARGIDWILTDSSVIQITDESPYIFHETHNKNVTPMEHFYSLLPPLQGFQIIKGYLIRKPNAEYEELMYPVVTDNIFLIPHGQDIWEKISDKIGLVTITNENNNYLLDIIQGYSTSDSNITGIAFLGDNLYGFKADENNKGLCFSSQNLNLYSFENGAWETLSEGVGKIYFDPFTNKSLALSDKGMELLPDKKSFECNALAQWVAPHSELHYVSDDVLISEFDNTTLITNITSGFHRDILTSLLLTSKIYNEYRLFLGIINNKFNINNFSIKNNNNKILIALRIDKPANKEWFNIGEIIDYSGIVIMAEYEDGELLDVTAKVIFYPENKTKILPEIEDIIASYTENGITKTITLNEMHLKIEMLSHFNHDICELVIGEEYPSFCIPSFLTKEQYTELSNIQNKDYSFRKELEEVELIFISPQNGQFITVNYEVINYSEYYRVQDRPISSWSGRYGEASEFDFGVINQVRTKISDYWISTYDGEIYYMYSESDYENTIKTKKVVANLQQEYFTHRSGSYEAKNFIIISDINSDKNEIIFRLQNSNVKASIHIDNLGKIIEEFPYPRLHSFTNIEEYFCVPGVLYREQFHVLVFYKYIEAKYGTIQPSVPIITFKTTISPIGLTIRRLSSFHITYASYFDTGEKANYQNDIYAIYNDGTITEEISSKVQFNPPKGTIVNSTNFPDRKVYISYTDEYGDTLEGSYIVCSKFS